MTWRRALLTNKLAEHETERPTELPWWHWSVIGGSDLERELCRRQHGPRRVWDLESQEPRLEPRTFPD